MSLLSRSEVDTKSWLLSLRGSAPVILAGMVGIGLSWLGLRVLSKQPDRDLALALYSLGSNPSILYIALAMATIGNVIWVPLVFWLYVFRKNRHEWTSAAVLAVAIAASMAASDLLKMIFDLNRPFILYPSEFPLRVGMPTNKAFPSGHTTMAFTVAAFVWRRYPAWRVPFLAVAVGTGVSMIVIGIHFPSDVIAGACLGTVSAAFATGLARLRAEPETVTG